MRRVLRYAIAVAAVTALVWLVASAMVSPDGRRGVAVGALSAGGWQLFVLGLLAVALPEKRLLAHGLGMLARLLMVGVMGLAVLPGTDLPQAPTLFTMVTVLFATTLIEPVLLPTGERNDRDR